MTSAAQLLRVAFGVFLLAALPSWQAGAQQADSKGLVGGGPILKGITLDHSQVMKLIAIDREMRPKVAALVARVPKSDYVGRRRGFHELDKARSRALYAILTPPQRITWRQNVERVAIEYGEHVAEGHRVP